MKRAEIEMLLPEVFRRTVVKGTPLFALLEVMESLHMPEEYLLDQIDGIFNPHRTPDAFVTFLAKWVDMERLFDRPKIKTRTAALPEIPISSGMGRLRELIASAAYFSQWRGTAKGLLLFIETATGLEGFTIDENVPDDKGQPRPFHIHVKAPKAGLPYRALIKRIIEMEKPAYVTFNLDFEEEDS